MSHSAEEHKLGSPQRLKITLFTVSSSRFRDKNLSDESGEIATDLCKKAGHQVRHQILDDNESMIRKELLRSLFEKDEDSVILLGGTGISPRDVTIEAVRPLLEKQLDGFGEIFRKLSFDQIGSPAIMTRAIAGTIGKKIVFCLPGSPDAARLGIELLLKEISHAVFIANSKP